VALVLGIGLAGCSTTGSAQSPGSIGLLDLGPTTKYAAYVVDANSGSALYQVNATASRYPASLTKMMTLYILFEALQQGRLTKQTQLPVSAYAAARPPTKMGLKPGSTIAVDEAIQAICTKSANDAAVAVAEYLGGSEEAFAAQMTAKARQLGMVGTVFRNASGLPDPDQHTTARDMALLGMALRQRFPSQYAYFSARDFAFRGKLVRGHNDMLGRVHGVDGIKTGYIRASGYNIVTSVNAEGRKLVVVVMGGETAKARNAQVEDLINRYLPSASRVGGGTLLAAF
jgi:D-alanyl-D-alanine carboxypeptidase